MGEGKINYDMTRLFWYLMKHEYENSAFSTEFAVRRCSDQGRWQGRPNMNDSSHGWTNFTNCYLPEVYALLKKLGNDREVSKCYNKK